MAYPPFVKASATATCLAGSGSITVPDAVNDGDLLMAVVLVSHLGDLDSSDFVAGDWAVNGDVARGTDGRSVLTSTDGSLSVTAHIYLIVPTTRALAGQVYDFAGPAAVVALLVVSGARGWSWTAGAPGTFGFGVGDLTANRSLNDMDMFGVVAVPAVTLTSPETLVLTDSVAGGAPLVFRVGQKGAAPYGVATPSGYCVWVSASFNWAVGPHSRPLNDNFADATAITGPSGTTSGYNVAATSEIGEQHLAINGGVGAGESVWWKWTAPSSGSATFDTLGSDFDTVLTVFDGAATVADATMVVFNDDFTGRTSQCTFDAVAGGTYWIRVDGYAADSVGRIQLAWSVGKPSLDVPSWSVGSIRLAPT